MEQLAQAKGMSEDQFADKLATTAEPALDELVQTHKITRAQADNVLATIRVGHIPSGTASITAQPRKRQPQTCSEPGSPSRRADSMFARWCYRRGSANDSAPPTRPVQSPL